jgi:DNA-binding GntR family transcriptional regulator
MSKRGEIRTVTRKSPMKRGKPSPQTLVERIADQLRERIIDGTFRAGEPLHQAALAKRMGASSIPLREAIRLLESEGFVEVVPFKGARVRRMAREELAERVEIAFALESHAMELTHPTLTAADFDRAADLAGRIFPAQSVEAWYARMGQLLGLLYGADRWPRLFELIQKNRMTGRQYMELLIRRTMTDKAWADQWAAPYFPRLVELLRTGDLQGARALQRKRMDETLQHFIHLIEQGLAQEARRPGKLRNIKGTRPARARGKRALVGAEV